MTDESTDEPDVTADAGSDDTIRDRFEAFPWAVGLATGCGAFVGGYLVLGVYLLVGVINELPGTIQDKLIQLGYVLYNSHLILITQQVAEPLPANQTFAPTPVSWLGNASQPAVYYIVPIVVLLGASALFTNWYQPEERSTATAFATGLSMTLGYLLFALLGTYLFTQTGVSELEGAETIQYITYPDRLQTLIYASVYPLFLGTMGSVGMQAYLVADDGETSADDEPQ